MLERRRGAVDALLVVVSNGVETLLFGALQDPRHRVDAHIKGFDGWAEGEAHEVVAWRGEQVAAVRRVDVEEDAGDDDALFLEKLLEERLRGEVSVDTMMINTRRTKPLLSGDGRCSRLSQM